MGGNRVSLSTEKPRVPEALTLGGSMVSLLVRNPRVPEALTLGGSMVPLIVQKPKVPEAKTLGVTELTLKGRSTSTAWISGLPLLPKLMYTLLFGTRIKTTTVWQVSLLLNQVDP